MVAGYQAWQKNFNRHVKRGEKGIRILAPAPYKIKEERDKLDPVTGEVMLDKDGMILSILVDTFFTRIFMLKLQHPEIHNISVV